MAPKVEPEVAPPVEQESDSRSGADEQAVSNAALSTGPMEQDSRSGTGVSERQVRIGDEPGASDRPDNFGDEESENPTHTPEPRKDPLGKQRIRLAALTLLGLGVIVLVGLFLYGYLRANGDEDGGELILDFMKTTMPPLATLILAAYFRSSGSS